MLIFLNFDPFLLLLHVHRISAAGLHCSREPCSNTRSTCDTSRKGKTPLTPAIGCLTDDVQGGLTSRGFALFKIPLGLSHLVRHIRKTDDLVLPGLSQRIESSRFHLHSKDSFLSTRGDHRFGLSERRIRSPTTPNSEGNTSVIPRDTQHLPERWSKVTIGRRRQVVVARSFITQGILDQHHVGRTTHRQDLPG